MRNARVHAVILSANFDPDDMTAISEAMFNAREVGFEEGMVVGAAIIAMAEAIRQTDHDRRFRAARERVMRDHADLFKRLADEE